MASSGQGQASPEHQARPRAMRQVQSLALLARVQQRGFAQVGIGWNWVNAAPPSPSRELCSFRAELNQLSTHFTQGYVCWGAPAHQLSPRAVQPHHVPQT